MKNYGPKVRLTSAMLLLLLLMQGASAAFARQAGRGVLTKEEERQAREVAAAFTDRLIETHDFAQVVSELYVGDFAARYLKREAASAARGRGETFMLAGVPALSFKETLAARDDEYWPRLYVAANNLINYGFLLLLSKKTLKELGDPDKFDEREMLAIYPPEAVKVLDSDPTTANFLKMKTRPVEVATPEDLREVTTTLEEAARLTRAGLGERLPRGARLEQNLGMLNAASARTPVELLPSDEDFSGYPKGTRLFRVFAPIGYNLTLLKEGGSMKIVWANMPED